MIYKAQTPQDLTIPMPITQEALEIAQRFANEQPTQQKALQVYLNTLAVCSVNNYLRIMDIPTDLTAGDSWNPVVRLATDVADLWVMGLGRLECRPVSTTNLDPKAVQKQNNNLWFRFISSKLTSEDESIPLVCHIPQEVQFGRIGYVVVQINSEQQEATLLGFSKTAATGELIISQLQPINDLLKQLESQSLLSVTSVNLSQWLHGVFEVGWQSVESLLDTQKANYAFRQRVANSIRRAKPIRLGTQLTEPTVALIVTLTQQKAANFDINLQVLPVGGETYLPVGLKLAILDESGEVFLEISSGSANNIIQTRQFSGQSGETFHVQISLDKDSITEYFSL
ncbi:MAG TPA: DUF1822 family protein [Coleofasciculaceae cyanobacterium]|jgi:hypothetical protein